MASPEPMANTDTPSEAADVPAPEQFPEPRPFVLAVTGSRGVLCRDLVDEWLDAYAGMYDSLLIVHGGADSGADAHAQDWFERGEWFRPGDFPPHVKVKVIRPDYGKYPAKAAPLERNTLIVQEADEIAAFWDGQSRGTWDTMQKANAADKPVVLIDVSACARRAAGVKHGGL